MQTGSQKLRDHGLRELREPFLYQDQRLYDLPELRSCGDQSETLPSCRRMLSRSVGAGVYSLVLAFWLVTWSACVKTTHVQVTADDGCNTVQRARLSGIVYGADGAPASGAQVRIRSLYSESTTFTDQHGRFSLLGIPKGRHSLAARANGAFFFDEITLARDQSIRLWLEPGAVAKVRVVDESGAVVAGASIRYGLWDVKADDKGEAALDAIQYGLSTIDVSSQYHASESIRVSLAQRNIVEGTVTVRLTKGQETRGWLVGLGSRRLEIVSRSRIGGRSLLAISDSGAWASRIRRGASYFLKATDAAGHTVITDLPVTETKLRLTPIVGKTLEGRVLNLPPAEEAYVRLTSEGHTYEQVTTAGRFRFCDVADAFDGMLDIDIEGAHQTVPVHSRRVPDTIVLNRDTVRGAVVDQRGRSVSDAWIEVRSRKSTNVTVATRSDKSGQFEATVSRGGEYVVRAGYPGQPRERQFSESVVRSGETIKVAVATPGTIRGALLLEDLPVSSFEVALSRPEVASIARPTVLHVVNSRGAFEIGNIEPGTWAVMVSGHGFAKRIIISNVIAGTITDLGTIRVSLGMSLQGEVRSSDGPVRNAKILLTPKADIPSPSPTLYPAWEDPAVLRMRGRVLTTTDASGAFIITNLPVSQSFVLKASFEGEASSYLQVPPRGGHIDVRTYPVGYIKGHVYGRSPGRVSLVEVRSSRGNASFAYVGLDGEFEVDDLRPDTYSLRLATLQDRFVSKPVLVEVTPSKVPIDVSLESEGGEIVTLKRAVECNARSIVIDGDELSHMLPCGDSSIRMRPGTHSVCVSGTCRTLIVPKVRVISLD